MVDDNSLSILKVWKPFQWFYSNPTYGSWDGYRVTEYILRFHDWNISNEPWCEFSLN